MYGYPSTGYTPPYSFANNARGSSSSRSRGRGSMTASYRGGRGRGGFTFHPGKGIWVATPPASLPPAPGAGPHRKLVNNNTSSGGANAGSSSSSTAQIPQVPVQQHYPPSKHLKLVNNAPSTSATANSSAVMPSSRPLQDVVIDGVVFTCDATGRKLVRKAPKTRYIQTRIEVTDANAPMAPTAGPSTPSKVSVAGQDYVRTKSGNLIAKSLVTSRALDAKRRRLNGLGDTIKHTQNMRNRSRRPLANAKKDTLCRFFTRTGECRNAKSCPYIHDPNKLAICPKFLKGSCEFTESTCTLSHTPDAHRMPHCVHFPNCRHGSDCKFPHIHVASNAPVCNDFADLGYCEAGERCAKRHVNECPQFSLNGTCSNKNCKMPHILRKKRDAPEPVNQEASADFISDTRPARVVHKKRPYPSQNEGLTDERIDADAVFRPKKARTDDLTENNDFITFDESSEIGDTVMEEYMSSVDSDDYEEEEERFSEDGNALLDEARGLEANGYTNDEEEEEEDDFDPSSLY